MEDECEHVVLDDDEQGTSDGRREDSRRNGSRSLEAQSLEVTAVTL